jgi:hypothetical protein
MHKLENMMTKVKENPLQLKSTKKLKSVMRQYFSGLEQASSAKQRKVAWCSSIGPCEWIGFCHVQGIIFHDAKTCPYNTNSRFAMPSRLNSELGIPTLIIDGDLNDLRCFSEEQAKTNIEAFVEQLEEMAGLSPQIPEKDKSRVT